MFPICMLNVKSLLVSSSSSSSSSFSRSDWWAEVCKARTQLAAKGSVCAPLPQPEALRQVGYDYFNLAPRDVIHTTTLDERVHSDEHGAEADGDDGVS